MKQTLRSEPLKLNFIEYLDVKKIQMIAKYSYFQINLLNLTAEGLKEGLKAAPELKQLSNKVPVISNVRSRLHVPAGEQCGLQLSVHLAICPKYICRFIRTLNIEVFMIIQFQYKFCGTPEFVD